MTHRQSPFTVGEWYHCFNHSIDKRTSFEDSQDYQRFLELLYLANDVLPLRRDDMGKRSFKDILSIPRGKRLVAIGAFCLMPNYFDVVLHEVSEGGITSFMRKVGTAYTLYFNARHKRAGNLFLKPFRSRHLPTSRSLQQITCYVHANPAILYEPKWKINHVVDPQFLEERLVKYPYSSLAAYTGAQTPTARILDAQVLSSARMLPLQKMLQEARQYFTDAGPS
jgi:hypothetical protein